MNAIHHMHHAMSERAALLELEPSKNYKLQMLCFSVANAERNLIDARARGFEGTEYEIYYETQTAKLHAALEELVTGEHELSKKVLTQIAMNRQTAASAPVQGEARHGSKPTIAQSQGFETT